MHPGGTLVLGAGIVEEALAVAERVADERGARIVRVDGAAERGAGVDGAVGHRVSAAAERGARMDDVVRAVPLAARGAFQQRNFALARAAAETYLSDAGIALDEQAVGDAARGTDVPGRLQVIDEHPLTVLDGAHNPAAVAALVQSLPEVFDGRAIGLVMGVLEDKDAASMLDALLGVCERAWFTAPPSPRALSPAALQSLARQHGFDSVVCEPYPERALEQARRWAGEAHHGDKDGRAVLATGSVYLVGDLLHRLQTSDTLRQQAAPQG